MVSASRLAFGTYFVLTSLYCLLAFVPYTYFFLVKAPPSEALIAFTRYHSLLYWIALALGVVGYWEYRKYFVTLAALLSLGAAGIVLTANNYLPHIQNNWAAYACSIGIILPLTLLAAFDSFRGLPAKAEDSGLGLLSYFNGIVVVLVAAAVSFRAIPVHSYSEATASGFWAGLLHAEIKHDLGTVQVMLLVLACFLWVTVLIISVLNLVLIVGTRLTRRPQLVRILALGTLIFAVLFVSSWRFLQGMLNLQGWQAALYALSLASTLTLWGFSLARSFSLVINSAASWKRAAPWIIAAGFACMALAVPTLIGDIDWNGIAQNWFTLLFWIILSVAVYTIRPRSKTYSAASIVAVLLIAGALYWGLFASAFLWAKRVGKTDDEIHRAMENYAARNVSFDLIYHWMDGGNTQSCQNLCLTLRQYTNIRDAKITHPLNLVEQLRPTQGNRPNILIVVVDSLRADYLGTYNPEVDFTPNLDEFARDSVVMRKAFTPYAGTTLAEPCIWTGSLLLHAHYVHPFEKVNTLERLLKTDGYQMVLSYDSVLRQILTGTDEAIKLDADLPWNHFEASSTFRQLESVLDKRKTNDPPFFFYAQPMNVHQFGVNDRAPRTSTNWVVRPGFENRAAYRVHQVDESFGDLFRYLKSRGLYDNSIIIVTADHGEGNEGLGHHAHSTVIYPEVMRIPLIVHLPKGTQSRVAYDENALSSLIDITPTLYALLGHGPIEKGLQLGRPLFAATDAELKSYPRSDLLLASDVRAAYGLVSGDGGFMYVTYDSPPQSYLYDLVKDPNATQSFFTDDARKKYEPRLIEYLQAIADFYGYKPNGNRSLVAMQ